VATGDNHLRRIEPAATGTPGAAATAGANGTTSPSVDHVAELPQRPSVLTTWLLLGLVLILAAVPLSVNIGVPEVFDRHEAAAIATSIHSYQEHALGGGVDQSRIAHLVPYYNHELAFDRAPGTYWLHRAIMAYKADPVADVDGLVRLLRLGSVGMALLTVAGVFWCGFSVGGQRTATLAALVLASNPVFIYHGRLASPAICHTGWAMLSVAAALWAIRPLKPAASPERQLLGWVICGLALGATALTVGTVAAVTVVIPILTIMLLCHNRVGHLMGLLAAMFMGVLLVMPWVLYAHEQDPEVWRHWLANLSAASESSLDNLGLEGGRRGAMLAMALLPWTIWYIAALAQPFSTSSKGERARLLLGCVWFLITTIVLVTMPQGAKYGHMLPALAPAAVLLAQLFNYYAQRAETGRYARLWRWLRWPHLLLLAVASVAGALVLFTGDWLEIPDHWRRSPWDLNEWVLPITVAFGLLVLVVIGGRWAWKNYPARAMIVWALWAIALATIVSGPLPHDKRATSRMRPAAERLVELTGQTNTYWYGQKQPDPAILLYARRAMPTVTTTQVNQGLERGQSFYLVCPAQTSAFADRMTLVETMHQVGISLWRFEAENE